MTTSSFRSAAPSGSAESPASTPSAADTRLDWIAVENDLWVATRDGEYAGMAERLGVGAYRVTDHVAGHIGRFRSLRAAQSALAGPGRARTGGRRAAGRVR